MEELTGSRAKVSLAAAQLMSAVMKKRGTDLIKVVWCWVGALPGMSGALALVLVLLPTSQMALAKSLSLAGFLIPSLLKCRLALDFLCGPMSSDICNPELVILVPPIWVADSSVNDSHVQGCRHCWGTHPDPLGYQELRPLLGDKTVNCKQGSSLTDLCINFLLS